MRARINTTGTHIKNGVLKVRIDLYPDPADRTYARHYVDRFDREPTEQELADPARLALVPTHKETNPCLCHFIEAPEGITVAQLQAYLEQLLTPDCLATIDNALVQPDAAHLISPYMRGRPKMAAKKVTEDAALVESVNSRLGALVVTGPAGGRPENISPGSIDIGPGAIVRSNDMGHYTLIELGNPANADGILDTWKVYAFTGMSNVEVATFYGSGNTYSTRDYETIGSVSSGSPQTFTGLHTDVVTGDYAGIYWGTGDIQNDLSGGAGVYRSASDQIPCTGATFTYIAGWADSIEAVGTETGGGAEEKTAAETGSGAESISGRGLAGGESGSGADTQDSRSFDLPEAGSGAESLGSRGLSAPDAGSGTEGALPAAALLAADTGLGTEFAHILGLFEAFIREDAGRGVDAFKALITRTGPDLKLRPDHGPVGLPHKEVNL
jgi:hypothetical protein